MTSGNIISTDSAGHKIWQVSLDGLPRYDAKGFPYSYYSIENVPSGFYRTINYTTDATNNKDITATITNYIPTGSAGYTTLYAEKTWYDGGNTAERKPVT